MHTFLLILALAQQQPDARALGIPLQGTTGKYNAITDVAGVEVGHKTLISGSNVRTGVTAILPRGKSGPDSAFAAWFTLNGNGEMTGTTWIREGGILETPILITNTHSVGVVRDATIEWMLRHDRKFLWTLPVVAETWDGILNDINGFHVKREDAWAALDNAHGGLVEQGVVGGGTGMMCNGFKGGIGSSSRVAGAYTVGVLVQCNYGRRFNLRIAGIQVGDSIKNAPLCYTKPVDTSQLLVKVGRCTATSPQEPPAELPELGSIIVVVATDAPLLSHQLDRIIKRVSLGLGRMGSQAGNGSGDIFIAFSTANRAAVGATAKVAQADMLPNDMVDPLFLATVQATEEAIINAMLAATDVVGMNDLKVPALPHDQVKALMQKYRK